MSDTHVHRRRKKSNRTNQQLQSALLIVLGLALTVVIATVGVYIYKNLTAQKETDPVLAAKALLQGGDGKSAGSPSLEEIAHEAYFRDSLLRWRPMGAGKLSFAVKGFAFELTFAADRVVFVGTATIGRAPDGQIDPRGLAEFLVLLTPKSSGGGAAVVEETKALSAVHAQAVAELSKNGKGPSPTANATGKGKLASATATFSYDDAAKRLTYRMEIAKNGGK